MASATETAAGPQQIPLDDKLKAFDSVPLFMRSLPTEQTDDPALEALQSLMYEGTPDEVADQFKDQGNEYFKGKRYREALGFYTQGVDAKPTDSKLLEALLCNRAACNLELQNYGSVLKDCSKVITINPKSSKAYYRSALALLALEKADEAVDCCERCLAFDGENKSVWAVLKKARKKKEELDKKKRVKMEKWKKEREEKLRLKAAYEERHLTNIPNPDSTNPHRPHFDPEDPSGKTLIFPVMFLYPQHAQTDLIPEFVETTAFSAHLAIMFPSKSNPNPSNPPPEWDRKGEYVDGNLVVYATTRQGRVLKVGKKMCLRDVIDAAASKEGDGLEVRDGCLTFAVLPKGEEEKRWVEEFKRSRGA